MRFHTEQRDINNLFVTIVYVFTTLVCDTSLDT